MPRTAGTTQGTTNAPRKMGRPAGTGSTQQSKPQNRQWGERARSKAALVAYCQNIQAQLDNAVTSLKQIPHLF